MMLQLRARTALAASALALAALPVLPGVASAQDRFDCGDFRFQEEAQAVFEQDRSDPSRLDSREPGQGDGVACESLPRRGGPATPDPTPSAPADDESAEGRDAEDRDAEDRDAEDDASGAAASGGEQPRVAAGDRDCPDFASQADAQAALEAAGSDPERLDSDGDGVACEEHFGDESLQVPVRPVGGVATGGRADGA